MSSTIVGQNIRRIRKEKGIKPEQLALGLNRTVVQVFNYEGGRTRISEDVIRAAAFVLGVDISELFREVKNGD